MFMKIYAFRKSPPISKKNFLLKLFIYISDLFTEIIYLHKLFIYRNYLIIVIIYFRSYLFIEIIYL